MSVSLYIHSFDATNHLVATRFVYELGSRYPEHPLFWTEDVLAWCTSREAAEAAHRLLSMPS